MREWVKTKYVTLIMWFADKLLSHGEKINATRVISSQHEELLTDVPIVVKSSQNDLSNKAVSNLMEKFTSFSQNSNRYQAVNDYFGSRGVSGGRLKEKAEKLAAGEQVGELRRAPNPRADEPMATDTVVLKSIMEDAAIRIQEENMEDHCFTPAQEKMILKYISNANVAFIQFVKDNIKTDKPKVKKQKNKTKNKKSVHISLRSKKR